MSGTRVRLGVNIDHVATIRNARGGRHPDPVRAARIAAAAGADGITVHLREDRRHISDADVNLLRRAIPLPLNLEMAATEEMVGAALIARPARVCLVPERRAELTTEGGLDLTAAKANVLRTQAALAAAAIPMTLFIDPDLEMVARAPDLGAQAVELHTGRLANAAPSGQGDALAELREAAAAAAALGLEVHAGHGLDYNTAGLVAAVEHVRELNIGHFLIGEAVFTGLEAVVRGMRRVLDDVAGTAA